MNVLGEHEGCFLSSIYTELHEIAQDVREINVWYGRESLDQILKHCSVKAFYKTYGIYGLRE